jgi:G:T-mismatch repair DNA endonuclease (very short patch repair protein)
VFGERWHDKSEIEPRSNIFSKYGYKTLFIWSRELNNKAKVKEKLNLFIESLHQ